MTMRRAKWYAVGFLAVFIMGAGLGFRLLPARGVNRRLALLRAARLPVSAVDLDVWYQDVPNDENRALLLVDASKDLVPSPKALERKRTESIKAEMLPAIREYLDKNQDVVAKLRRASDLPSSRFPVDLSAGYATLLPYLAPIKALANFLELEAEYAARTGDPLNAFLALETGFALASALRKEPLFVTEMVAISCDSQFLDALERTLNNSQLNLAQLTTLERLLAEQEAGGLNQTYLALVGERAMSTSTFKASFQQFEAFSATPSTSSTGNDWLKPLVFDAFAISGLRERDEELYLNIMERFVNSAQATTFPEALRRWDEATAFMHQEFSTGFGRFAFYSHMLAHPLENGIRKEAVLAARLRCAEVALAIESFRVAHPGSLPETLAELSPTYLHRIPTDPFDGAALVYERKPTAGYSIFASTAVAERKKDTKNGDDTSFNISR